MKNLLKTIRNYVTTGNRYGCHHENVTDHGFGYRLYVTCDDCGMQVSA